MRAFLTEDGEREFEVSYVDEIIVNDDTVTVLYKDYHLGDESTYRARLVRVESEEEPKGPGFRKLDGNPTD